MLSARFLLIIETMSLFLKILCLSFIFISSYSVAEDEPENAAPASPAASGSVANTPTIPRTEPDTDQTIISNLIKVTPPDSELLQLDTSKPGEKMIAFYQAESSGVKQGGIIIFPDDHTHFDWPGDLNHLRQGLTGYGWHTLAVYLPQIEPTEIPERTLPVLQPISATTASQAEGEPEAAQAEPTPAPPEESPPAQKTVAEAKEKTEPYHEQAVRRGQTAFAYLQKQEVERFVVMGIGTGAVWAAQYVKQFQESQDLRLVMIDARIPQTDSAPDLLELLPEIETTVLDLHHGARKTSMAENPTFAERRLRVTRQNELTNFHQSRLPETHDDWKKGNPWLLKHVRGMLNTYVIKAEQKAFEMQTTEEANSAEMAPGNKPN